MYNCPVKWSEGVKKYNNLLKRQVKQQQGEGDSCEAQCCFDQLQGMLDMFFHGLHRNTQLVCNLLMAEMLLAAKAVYFLHFRRHPRNSIMYGQLHFF